MAFPIARRRYVTAFRKERSKAGLRAHAKSSRNWPEETNFTMDASARGRALAAYRRRPRIEPPGGGKCRLSPGRIGCPSPLQIRPGAPFEGRSGQYRRKHGFRQQRQRGIEI